MSNSRPSFAGQAARGFAEDMATFAIGGTIWREVQSNDGVQRRPWPRLSIQIKGTGRFAETDAQGRFRFYGLQPGDYWLVVRQKAIPPQGEGALLKEERITVAWPPSYDVTVPVIYREASVLTADVTPPAAAPDTSPPPASPEPTPNPADNDRRDAATITTTPAPTDSTAPSDAHDASSGKVMADHAVDEADLPGRLTGQPLASPTAGSEDVPTATGAETAPVAPTTESAPTKKLTRKRTASTTATPPKGASEA